MLAPHRMRRCIPQFVFRARSTGRIERIAEFRELIDVRAFAALAGRYGPRGNRRIERDHGTFIS